MLCVAVLTGGALLYHNLQTSKMDREAAEGAVSLVAGPAEDLGVLEANFSLARVRVETIHDLELRSFTLAEITDAYTTRKATLEDVARTKHEVLRLMQQDYSSLYGLTQARKSAEQLAAGLTLTESSIELLGQIAQLFDKQRDTIAQRVAEDERRRAEEERRRRLEAERVAQRLRDEAARTQAENDRRRREEESRRREEESQREAQRRSAPTDCCCKTKVERGLLGTRTEVEYRRLPKGKCTKPGFFDSHYEGWCVPDSSCH